MLINVELNNTFCITIELCSLGNKMTSIHYFSNIKQILVDSGKHYQESLLSLSLYVLQSYEQMCNSATIMKPFMLTLILTLVVEPRPRFELSREICSKENIGKEDNSYEISESDISSCSDNPSSSSSSSSSSNSSSSSSSSFSSSSSSSSENLCDSSNESEDNDDDYEYYGTYEYDYYKYYYCDHDDKRNNDSDDDDDEYDNDCN
ncbi:suppressor protein SRP40-like [Homalodisca vitripennis]|uniref:suppressor protein SRP40-like n=1 Tax=Homalodisca vitripennis TaxID=197043 RepID=UPI001EEA5D2D|nr:suppressor protein SRP40-like [Homalodisca vitripennis]